MKINIPLKFLRGFHTGGLVPMPNGDKPPAQPVKEAEHITTIMKMDFVGDVLERDLLTAGEQCAAFVDEMRFHDVSKRRWMRLQKRAGRLATQLAAITLDLSEIAGKHARVTLPTLNESLKSACRTKGRPDDKNDFL